MKAAGRSLILILALGLAMSGCASLGTGDVAPVPPAISQTLAALDDPSLAGTGWGVLAVATDGRAVVEFHADDRFIPASVTKVFTTAAAFALLNNLDAPDFTVGTSVRIEPDPEGGAPDVVLVGAGDPALGDGPGCVAACLSELADATAASLSRAGDVIGDDRLFPDERWGPGWSWEDMQEPFGAAVSALTLNDNIVALEVMSGVVPGAPVQARWPAGDDLFVLENAAATTADGEADLRLERRPGEDLVRLYGRMPVDAAVRTMRIGLDDPARSAALRFRRLLEERGVIVEGEARARHRPLALGDDPTTREEPISIQPDGIEVARLAPLSLLGSLVRTSKTSQNLYAELILRRLGRLQGSGSRADGLEQVATLLDRAGVERASFDLYDGSGMSAYNRVSPRATTAFLLWAMSQPWGEAWRATLPVGGRDGTLARRFVGTPLEGKIFAKTGSLKGVNALAGFLTAASGRTLVFSVYANDRPSTAGSATEAMDRMLLALAAEN